MLQTTSLTSMLGMQAQQQSALPLQQTLSGAAPTAVQQTVPGQQPTDPADQQGSLFQAILKFMQSPNAASASALQQRLASAPSQRPGAADTSITLPFPLDANDAPPADDQSTSGVMQFSPFMFTSIAQLQQALQAAMRGQTAVVEEGGSAAPAAVADAKTIAAADADGSTAAEQPVRSAGAEGVAPEALAPIVNGQPSATDMALSASLIGAGAPAQQMPPVADSTPQPAAAADAPTQVSALAARRIAGEDAPTAPIAHDRAAATQARAASAAEQQAQTAQAEEPIPEFAAPLNAALADAHVPGAQQSAAGNTPASQADARTAADASAAADPARTPEIFTRLHEAIAQAQEPAAAKMPVKAAPAQPTREARKGSTENRTASAVNVKQPADAPVREEMPGVQPAAAHTVNATEQAPSAAQAQPSAHETMQTAQRIDAVPADVHASARADMQIQHPALAATDVQTRGAVTTHDAATVLSPRAKEDVFEKVFREVSSIRHTPASVDVTLSPESLGKVTVNVGMEEGKMSARINVQNTDVKQIIEANMSRLQDALNSSGLSLDSIAVFVNNSSSFADRKNDAPKKKQAAADLAAESAVDSVGTLPQESKQYGYNTVEYIM